MDVAKIGEGGLARRTGVAVNAGCLMSRASEMVVAGGTEDTRVYQHGFPAQVAAVTMISTLNCGAANAGD